MGWSLERIRKLVGPFRRSGRDGRSLHAEGSVQTPLGAVPVALASYCNSSVERVRIGAAVNLTAEQADHLLTLLRAVEPYPKPAGATKPGEPVAFEVGGESG